MNNSDIFLKHKYVIAFFLFIFLIYMVCYYKSSMGLFFDIPSVFFAVIFPIDSITDKFLMFHHDRVRIFNDFLVGIPFNIFFPVIKNSSVINALRLFSTSYFIVHLFALIVNYLIARRTGRYDIAAICLAFYTFFCIPNYIWAIRECNITVLFYFALLSYFLSREKLGKRDLIPVCLLLIYMFESFETTIIYGLILFGSMFMYLKKERTELNPWFKILIGFVSVITVFYIPLRTIRLHFSESVSLSGGLIEWIQGSSIAFTHLFDGSLIITWTALLGLLVIIFYKKEFNFKSLFIIIPIVIGCVFLLYKINAFVPEPHIELQNYSFVLWFIFPVICCVILLDYFNININKYNKSLFSNMVVIACIAGILNICWQINSCFEFKKYETYLRNLIKNSSQIQVTIPKEDFEKYSFLKFNTCFGTIQKSIFLSDDYVVNKIIMPSDYYPDYSKFCSDSKDKTFFDKNKNIIYIQTAPLKLQTQYWDVTPIKEEFERQGRVKP